MLNLDPSADFEYQRPQPEGDLIMVQIGSESSKLVKIGDALPPELWSRFMDLLEKNVDLFAWSPSDMSGINPDICCHKLALKPGTTLVAQKKQRMGPERAEAIEKQVKELLEAGFIREVWYSDWVSNVVMVKKSYAIWRVCTDYTNLNKACPKDPFPLSCIEKLVDSSARYKYLSFMDTYFGYN
jgi:hypothetical protein